MKVYKRKAVFEMLSKYEPLANEGDWIEVTAWNYGQGFDVEIYTKSDVKRFGLSFGELKAIKRLVKKLDSDETDDD